MTEYRNKASRELFANGQLHAIEAVTKLIFVPPDRGCHPMLQAAVRVGRVGSPIQNSAGGLVCKVRVRSFFLLLDCLPYSP